MSKTAQQFSRKHTQMKFQWSAIPTEDSRAGTLRTKEAVREALKTALDNSPLGRDTVAKELSRLVGEDISVHSLNNWCAEVFDAVDLLITPTVPFDPPPAKGPFPDKTEGKKQIPAAVASFTIPFNLSWHPAATVRAGMSTAGFPIGLQIVGPRHREDLVLQAARAFEAKRPWHPDWPTTW